ncbi:hypothetical protein chiPu_0032103, partial [Chiloscyllium punctatum]|nr:hypothetical protein [Chiloscyllium punctatum]
MSLRLTHRPYFSQTPNRYQRPVFPDIRRPQEDGEPDCRPPPVARISQVHPHQRQCLHPGLHGDPVLPEECTGLLQPGADPVETGLSLRGAVPEREGRTWGISPAPGSA